MEARTGMAPHPETLRRRQQQEEMVNLTREKAVNHSNEGSSGLTLEERQAELDRAARERSGIPEGSVHHELVNALPPEFQEFKAELVGAFWYSMKQLLDIVEVTTPNDRTWTILRQKMLDIINQGRLNQSMIVGNFLGRLKVEGRNESEEVQDDRGNSDRKRAVRTRDRSAAG